MARGRPFKPGNNANPGGRPKLAEELRKKALKAVEDHVVDYWIEEVSTRGDNAVKCSELLAAYGLGKPAQPVTGPDGGAVQIESAVKIYLPENGRK
jgi:hypothetical protein